MSVNWTLDEIEAYLPSDLYDAFVEAGYDEGSVVAFQDNLKRQGVESLEALSDLDSAEVIRSVLNTMSQTSTSEGSSDPALLELLAFMRGVYSGTGADQTSAHDRNIREAFDASAFSVVQANLVGNQISDKFAQMLPHIRDLAGLKATLEEEGLLAYFPGVALAIEQYIDGQSNYKKAAQSAWESRNSQIKSVGDSFFSLLTAPTNQLPTGNQAKRLEASRT